VRHRTEWGFSGTSTLRWPDEPKKCPRSVCV
jgi:hypothetical protein